ncbi:unnamed protein product [Blumeria hordei]|uniref:Orotidine 5'-phosphate decarboxylase n=2 Tax=Blumeria hordei TaxID=2867405 RepID=A0A383UPV6_BLUHO|nr:unnamed protein product [Blumeria hordei]
MKPEIVYIDLLLPSMFNNPSTDVRKMTYAQRAKTATHPLSSYLLRLMAMKKSNLCLSADVTTANQLLSLANNIGPSIVVLKTHYDLISNWDYSPQTGTGARLAEIARRYNFLIFEDRKLGDIGNTVQLQYTEGTARIIEWSHIINVNMVPGKAVVSALAQAAERWSKNRQYEVKTDISVGNFMSKEEDLIGPHDLSDQLPTSIFEQETFSLVPDNSGRKSSIVSVTTVSQHFEPINSPRNNFLPTAQSLLDIEEAPMERGLLILAQMSSEGNFMTREYTNACVAAARDHQNFVMGFISQESLNTESDDMFLSMTPGCQLPPEDEDESCKLVGDGKGQQYNTPSKIINLMGNDIIIVGRGIIKADNPVSEAERYRSKAWKAYEERIALA